MKFQAEHSSGGLVLQSGSPSPLKRGRTGKKIEPWTPSGRMKILMVQVRNLENEIVWTFPKGHIEKGESREKAALREVKEETGWDCKIHKIKNRPFGKVKYFFQRGTNRVRKDVVWYLMQPLSKTSDKDPLEIRKVRWFGLPAAFQKTVYSSDKKLLKKLHAKIE